MARKGKPAGSAFDYLTLIGVTLSVGAIVGGNMLEGGRITSLLQLTAFVIVTPTSIVIASTITAATTTALTAISLRSSLDDRVEVSTAD